MLGSCQISLSKVFCHEVYPACSSVSLSVQLFQRVSITQMSDSPMQLAAPTIHLAGST